METDNKNQRKKRIMLITPMLHQGGFERICVLTARLLNNLYDVYLITFTTKDIFYDVSGLHLIDLNLGAVEGRAGKIINICKRVRRLKRLKRELRIDISYSFGTTANLVNVLSKDRDITLAGIRGYSAISDNGAGLIFRNADCVVSCTRTMEAKINKAYHTKNSCTLYNPCDLEEIKELSQREPYEANKSTVDFVNREGMLIVSMGREDDLKGFWHLLKSFAVINKELPASRLMIIGDGSYAEYRELADNLGISDAVCFTGALKNPFPLLSKADVYALTSQSEGFPNALIEAMACGVPCVSVNCMTGPAEILAEHYENCGNQNIVYEAEYGILTPIFEGGKDLAPNITEEEKKYAQVIIGLIKDKAKLQKYREGAVKRAKDFGTDRYVVDLTEIISEV